MYINWGHKLERKKSTCISSIFPACELTCFPKTKQFILAS